MAYNVQTLPNYVEQNRSDLMSAAVLSPKSATLFSLMPNVKGETTITSSMSASFSRTAEPAPSTPLATTTSPSAASFPES